MPRAFAAETFAPAATSTATASSSSARTASAAPCRRRPAALTSWPSRTRRCTVASRRLRPRPPGRSRLWPSRLPGRRAQQQPASTLSRARSLRLSRPGAYYLLRSDAVRARSRQKRSEADRRHERGRGRDSSLSFRIPVSRDSKGAAYRAGKSLRARQHSASDCRSARRSIVRRRPSISASAVAYPLASRNRSEGSKVVVQRQDTTLQGALRTSPRD